MTTQLRARKRKKVKMATKRFLRQHLVDLGMRLFLASKQDNVCPEAEPTQLIITDRFGTVFSPSGSERAASHELDQVLAEQAYLERPISQPRSQPDCPEQIADANRQTLRAQKLTVLGLQRWLERVAQRAGSDFKSWPVFWIRSGDPESLQRGGLSYLLQAPPTPRQEKSAADFLAMSRDWAWDNEVGIARAFREYGLDRLTEQGVVGTAEVDKQLGSATISQFLQPVDISTSKTPSSRDAIRVTQLSDVLIYPRTVIRSVSQHTVPERVVRLLAETPTPLQATLEIVVGAAVKERTVQLGREESRSMEEARGSLLLFRSYVIDAWSIAVEKEPT